MIYHTLYFLFLFVGILQIPLYSWVDFEREMLSSFVGTTQKIDIPGYPDAFNPSILDWDLNTRLLSFRTYDPLTRSTNGIGFVFLDRTFKILGKPYLLQVNHSRMRYEIFQQDPRLIRVGEKIYIVYANLIDGIAVPKIRRVCLGELIFDGESFYIDEPDIITDFPGENPLRFEKNWVPFEYNGELLLSQTINPHIVLRPYLGTDACEMVASTEAQIDWPWGMLRGGTTALHIGDRYLSIFHSTIEIKTDHSLGKKISHYFMGAYTFSDTPPFQLTAISPNPIVARGFYYGPLYNTWKPLRCVFPGGYVIDEEFLWVAYGRQDHEIWIIQIDKKQLLESLIPVNQK